MLPEQVDLRLQRRHARHLLGQLLLRVDLLLQRPGALAPATCRARRARLTPALTVRVCLCGACSGGFRVALVYTVHMTMATGVTTSGREIAWDT